MVHDAWLFEVKTQHPTFCFLYDHMCAIKLEWARELKLAWWRLCSTHANRILLKYDNINSYMMWKAKICILNMQFIKTDQITGMWLHAMLSQWVLCLDIPRRHVSGFVLMYFLAQVGASLCVWWPMSGSTCVAPHGWPDAHTQTATYPSSLLSDPGRNVFLDKL